ncbi:MAG: hypothetical protein IJ451_05195 [Ruminococcus sp.]|nr:hypothetical protein [Ruminococcus sp.]
MFKKILFLALALVCIASMAVIGVNAAEDTTIYFEVPSNWNNYSTVYCHIWVYGGDSLAAWQSKKEKCTEVEAGLYSYDVSKVGGLADGQYYGVIFSIDIGLQTYDTLMTSACYGDTLYADGTEYENPADSSKKAVAAFWKNKDKSAFGPVMQVTSIGNLIGTCIAPGETAEGLFNKFITGENLENARTYSGKNDQAIIDDISTALGLSQDTTEKLIKESGVEGIAWEKAQSVAPTVDAPVVKPSAGGAVSSGQETTVVVVALAVMIAAAGVVFFARKKVTE